MRTEIKSIGKVERKLASVKAIKNLTGLGLKESMEIIDNLVFVNRANPIEILNWDNKDVQVLRENNIILDDREDKINDILMDLLITIPSDGIEYKIFDGTYEIDKGVLLVDVISGKFINHNQSSNWSRNLERDLSNITLKLPFEKCLIEDYA